MRFGCPTQETIQESAFFLAPVQKQPTHYICQQMPLQEELTLLNCTSRTLPVPKHQKQKHTLLNEPLQFQIQEEIVQRIKLVTPTYTFVQYQWKHDEDQSEEKGKFPGIPPMNTKPLLQNTQMHFTSILLSRQHIPCCSRKTIVTIQLSFSFYYIIILCFSLFSYHSHFLFPFCIFLLSITQTEN